MASLPEDLCYHPLPFLIAQLPNFERRHLLEDIFVVLRARKGVQTTSKVTARLPDHSQASRGR